VGAKMTARLCNPEVYTPSLTRLIDLNWNCTKNPRIFSGYKNKCTHERNKGIKRETYGVKKIKKEFPGEVVLCRTGYPPVQCELYNNMQVPC
jgi:hypothetical protein